jgi:hypothetical protein
MRGHLPEKELSFSLTFSNYESGPVTRLTHSHTHQPFAPHGSAFHMHHTVLNARQLPQMALGQENTIFERHRYKLFFASLQAEFFRLLAAYRDTTMFC